MRDVRIGQIAIAVVSYSAAPHRCVELRLLTNDHAVEALKNLVI